MKCPRCKLTEMIVDIVVDNKVKHYCRSCGNEEISEIQEEMNTQELI